MSGEHACNVTSFDTRAGGESGRLGTSEAASDLTPTPPRDTPIERSITMQNIPGQPCPQSNVGGVA